jgi:ketosteroid isomerase-like protein
MTIDERALQQLIDKDAIRELVQCYSRAVDRKDIPLLRDLYTDDATDSHGDTYDGPAQGLCDYIEGSMQHMIYGGHHACNHMVSVDGDEGNGEVYAFAYHVVPGPDGGRIEDFMLVRYIDNYRRCADRKWRFARRVVTYDVTRRAPFTGGGLMGLGADDPIYEVCRHRLFQRGPRG